MAKKKTEQLAWELRLIAPPETIFSTFEDEDPSLYPQEALGLDTLWPDLWIEVPDQPDFEGRSAKAQAWLDKHAPLSGLYRLRRLVDEQLVSVQMVLTIQRLPTKTEIDIKLRGANEAKKSVAKVAAAVELLDDAASKKHSARAVKKLVEETEELMAQEAEDLANASAAEIDPRGPEIAAAVDNIDPDALDKPLPCVGDRVTTKDGTVVECVAVDPEKNSVGWAVVEGPPEKGEAPEKEPTTASEALRRNQEAVASAGELDLAAAPPEKPKNGNADLTARAVWVASPLRKCRSLQECCLCDDPITSGANYYDRGHGKRAHEGCVNETVDF